MPIDVICPCGQLFTVKPSLRITGRGIYCSRTCKYTFTSTKELLYCIVCHASFYATLSQWEHGRKYCSKTCYDLVRCERETFMCIGCGDAFERTPGYARKGLAT